jgi:hypothetical protein
MTDVSEVAALFDNKPGFLLVDFEEVGLPVYRLISKVLVLDPKIYPPIDEFVMKCIDADLRTSPQIAGLLGIEERIVEASLTNLIRDDEVIATSEGILSLTRKAKLVLQGEDAIKPREQTIPFTFDGLTRRPQFFGTSRLLSPHELKAAGMREIRAFPARKPESHEVDVRDLEEALLREEGTTHTKVKLLRVREIGRKENKYLPAVMLIYRSRSGSDVRVSFAVDGRLSILHERAFVSAGGVEKLGIKDAILNSPQSISLAEVIGQRLASEIAIREAPVEESVRLKRKASIARFKAQISESQSPSSNADTGSGGKSNSVTAAALAEAQAAEHELSKLKVRPIAVYEHPPLLEDAITRAQKRVLILSPWITPAVVDARFLKNLREAIERGVSFYIGYGLDDRTKSRSEMNFAEAELHKFAEKSQSFKVVRLGDTHAKVLLKDSDWFVVSSFNWLSFRGDPKRTFREEWGTLVGVKPVVNKYFDDLISRFSNSGTGR